MLYANNIVHNLRISGVTLAELMITLAIAAIVFSMAIPSFSLTITRSQIVTYTNEFLTYLSFARNEALMRGNIVTLCKSSDGATCVTTGGWEQGWIAFSDTGTIAQVDPGDVILRVHGKLYGYITLTGDANVLNAISYSSDGRTGVRGIWSFCDQGIVSKDSELSSGLRSAIEVTRVGRARSNVNCKFCNDPLIVVCTNGCTAVCP